MFVGHDGVNESWDARFDDVPIEGKTVRCHFITLSRWLIYIAAETVQSNLLVIIEKL